MKIDVWKCDCCGKEYREDGGTTYSVPYPDDSIDLCLSCLAKSFYLVVDQMLKQSEQKRSLLKLIREQVPLKYEDMKK